MPRLRQSKFKAKNLIRAIRCWFIPYLKSRYHSQEFRPLCSFLFTDWKCNVDCHYCWAWDNTKKGMTLETAKRSIDFLKSVGCRVVGIMGGEPLVRKDFILDLVRYGADHGFFVYLPTNGILMDEEFIDRIGDAGIAAVNVAVDCITERPGLPKSLMRIEPQFRYLVKQQRKYGYIIWFNINITSKNLRDVKMLTEIAHDNGIPTDYHANEPHIIDRDHFKHRGSDLWITPDDWEKVDSLLDWLMERNRHGYVMVNSLEHLRAMKDFIRMKMEPWECRAGQNSSFIGVNGEMAPCMGLYDPSQKWGSIFDYHFDPERLKALKEKCSPKCLSTTNYQLRTYYQSFQVHKWVLKHMRKSFTR